MKIAFLMKQILTFLLTIAIGGLFIFSTSSCTREFTCQCVMSYTGAPGLPDTSIREYPIRDTRKNAEDLCQGNSKVFQEGNIITHEDCDLW